MGAAQILNAPITAVEIFRTSAIITRRAPLPAPAGPGPLVVELRGLPLGLVDSSPRARLDPPGESRVVDLHLGLALEGGAAQASVPEAEEVKRLRREVTALELRRAQLAQRSEEELRLRPQLPPTPRQADQPRFAGEPAPAWLALVESGQRLARRHQDEARELERRLRELGEALRAASERLELLSGEARRAPEIAKVLRLTIDPPPAGPQELELTYQVPGARWYPTYELHVDQGGERAELVMSALLAQRTGEDWSAVPVALSTADLARSAALPRLPAWRIGRARPPEHRPAWRPLPEDLATLFRDYDRDRPPPPPAAALPALELPGRGALGLHSASAPTALLQRASDQTTERVPLAQDDLRTTTRSLDLGEVEQAEEPSVDYTPAPDSDGAGHFNSSEMPAHVIEALRARSRRMDEGAADRPAPPLEMPAAPPPSTAAMMLRQAPSGFAAQAPAEEQAKKEWPEEAPRGAGGALGAKVAKERRARAPSGAPTDELLAYGALVLAGPDEASRGALRPALPGEALAAGTDPELATRLDLAEFHRGHGLAELDCLDLPAGVISVEESAGHFAYRYPTRLSSPAPSDGQLRRITVLRAELPIRLLHRALPLVEPTVFRVAAMTNPLGRPLLAGPLDVFWQGDFLVTSQLRTTASGGTIEASLGVEPAIKVARNVHHSQREGGLLGGRTLYDEEIVIEVESHLPREAILEVLERLPVSDDRKVEIKPGDETPPAEAYEQKERGHPVRGGRRWTLRLAPKRRERCVLRYQIALPTRSELVGGGRRA